MLVPPALRENTITFFFFVPALYFRIAVKGNEDRPAEQHVEPNTFSLDWTVTSQTQGKFSPFAAVWAEISQRAG